MPASRARSAAPQPPRLRRRRPDPSSSRRGQVDIAPLSCNSSPRLQHVSNAPTIKRCRPGPAAARGPSSPEMLRCRRRRRYPAPAAGCAVTLPRSTWAIVSAPVNGITRQIGTLLDRPLQPDADEWRPLLRETAPSRSPQLAEKDLTHVRRQQASGRSPSIRSSTVAAEGRWFSRGSILPARIAVRLLEVRQIS